MLYFVDIDNTICQLPENFKGKPYEGYEKSIPIKENIEKINRLYDEDNIIVYWSSRGAGTQLQDYWLMITKKQFEEWGVKYHDIRLTKPVFDCLIDDRAINSETFFKEKEENKNDNEIKEKSLITKLDQVLLL